MSKYFKFVMMAVMAIFLVGCDIAGTSSSGNGDKSAAAQRLGKQVELLGGRYRFTVPDHLEDRSGQLIGQTSDMQVYSDRTGLISVIALVTEADESNLEVVIEALANQYETRDAGVKIVEKQAIDLHGHVGWRLDTIGQTQGQLMYSSIIMTLVGDKLVTLQMSFPLERNVTSEPAVQRLIDSIVIQDM